MIEKLSSTMEVRNTFILKTFLLQVIPFCALAGSGMVLAGNLLEWAHRSGRLKQSVLLIMIPPLIGIKGNIEMTFSSKISTIANTYNSEISTDLFHLIMSNFLLTFVLAVLGGGVVALIALMLSASSVGGFREAYSSFSLAIISSSFATVFIGVCILLIIILCTKVRIDPDNVTAPIAATLGDTLVLFLMTIFLWAIENVLGFELIVQLSAVLCLVMACGPALSYLHFQKGESCLAADLQTLNCSVVPLLTAICFSSLSGRLLASYVDLLPQLARLQPAVNGVGGNLVSILISRMTTRLSSGFYGSPVNEEPAHLCSANIEPQQPDTAMCWHSCLLAIPSQPSCCIDIRKENGIPFCSRKLVNLAIDDSNLVARTLLFACVPLHLFLIFMNCLLSDLLASMGYTTTHSPSQSLSPAVVFAYVSACLLQIFILLKFARWLVINQWLRLVGTANVASSGVIASLDLTSIAISTGLGDLLGTLILITTLHVSEIATLH